MATAINYVELESGTIIKATNLDGSTNSISIITGTAEPFTKLFKNGITVESWDGTDAIFEADVVISGSISYNNIYSYSGGTTTLTTSDFGKATVFLLKPTIGSTVTVELPALGNSGEARLFIIKKLSTLGTVTIDPVSSYTIDGAVSVSATAQYSYIQVIYSGNNTDYYTIIANNGFS